MPGARLTAQNVTYPRFLSLPNPAGGLLLEYRTGMSGLGDCLMSVYNKGRWIQRGVYLKGIKNNPYV